MDLVRDLLDEPLRDRHGREMGRADAVVLQVDDGRQPRVVAIEIGPSVLGHRLHPALGRIVAALEDAFGVGMNRPTRIAVRDIKVGEEIVVNVSSVETGADNVERACRRLLGGR